MKKQTKKPSAKESKGSQTGKDKRGRFIKGNKCAKDHWFKPGQSGNPKGRPKGLDLTNSLQKQLHLKAKDVPFVKAKCEALGIDVDEEDLLVVDALIASGLLQCLNGNSKLFSQVWERIEGAVQKNLRLTEDDPVQDYLNMMRDRTQPEAPTPTPTPKTTKKVGGNGNGKSKKVRVTKKNGNGRKR